MKIVTDGKYAAAGSVVVLGMFDGVHIGHRVLLERGRALADQTGLPLIVVTFSGHPLQVIAPEKAPRMLMDFEEKTALFTELGVDVLYTLPFDRQIMNMLPEEYVGELVRRFHPKFVVCGYNHTFGKMGGGTPALLEGLGAALGFGTAVVPKITYEGMDVSSTQIRGMLAEGNVSDARRLLGRPYSLELGFENGNAVFTQSGKQLPADGRYRVLYDTENGSARPGVLVIRDGAPVLNSCTGSERAVRFLARN